MSSSIADFAKKKAPHVDAMLDYINASPSPFHCVDTTAKILDAAGFTQISEKKAEDWTDLKPNGKYYFTRNQSTLFAFAIGGKFVKGNGFAIAAAHTDSPVLRVKPCSAITAHGFLQVGVECYGGGLWNTWFDRDLSVAGRVIVQDAKDASKYTAKLVRIDRPIMRIPNLAIHLNRKIYTDGFKPNKETETVPILATAVKAALSGTAPASAKSSAEGEDGSSALKKQKISEKHHSLLVQMLAAELGCEVEHIRDFELSLYDTQGSCVTGAFNEFIASPRLDNQMMSFCSTQALIDSLATLADETHVRCVALFDNEEVGSQSNRGAASIMMKQFIGRVSGHENYDTAAANTMLVSADMAHAHHPNYSSKHESQHRPELHKGLVIKTNSNCRYATTSVSSFMLRQMAADKGIPVQDFVVRNDVGCGSTVGPMLSANCGIRTVDVGAPQFAMHSVRECCGTADVAYSVDILTTFMNEFSTRDAKLTVDH